MWQKGREWAEASTWLRAYHPPCPASTYIATLGAAFAIVLTAYAMPRLYASMTLGAHAPLPAFVTTLPRLSGSISTTIGTVAWKRESTSAKGVTYSSSYSLNPLAQQGPWVLAHVGPLAVCEQSPALPPLQQISPLLALALQSRLGRLSVRGGCEQGRMEEGALAVRSREVERRRRRRRRRADLRRELVARGAYIVQRRRAAYRRGSC